MGHVNPESVRVFIAISVLSLIAILLGQIQFAPRTSPRLSSTEVPKDRCIGHLGYRLAPACLDAQSHTS
jgi:hypothetical protein